MKIKIVQALGIIQVGGITVDGIAWNIPIVAEQVASIARGEWFHGIASYSAASPGPDWKIRSPRCRIGHWHNGQTAAVTKVRIMGSNRIHLATLMRPSAFGQAV
jgi:hypothetical protein